VTAKLNLSGNRELIFAESRKVAGRAHSTAAGITSLNTCSVRVVGRALTWVGGASIEAVRNERFFIALPRA